VTLCLCVLAGIKNIGTETYGIILFKGIPLCLDGRKEDNVCVCVCLCL
jgi:hypothetical protein